MVAQVDGMQSPSFTIFASRTDSKALYQFMYSHLVQHLQFKLDLFLKIVRQKIYPTNFDYRCRLHQVSFRTFTCKSMAFNLFWKVQVPRFLTYFPNPPKLFCYKLFLEASCCTRSISCNHQIRDLVCSKHDWNYFNPFVMMSCV